MHCCVSGSFVREKDPMIIFWFLKEADVVYHSFPVDQGGTVKSVIQYFQETYGFAIQHTYLPCLQVGNQQRPNYLPMEVSLVAEAAPLAL